MYTQYKSTCGEELKHYHLYLQRESWSRIRVFIIPHVDSSFPVIGYNGGTIQEQHSQTMPFQKFAQTSFSAQVQINPFQAPCPQFSKKPVWAPDTREHLRHIPLIGISHYLRHRSMWHTVCSESQTWCSCCKLIQLTTVTENNPVKGEKNYFLWRYLNLLGTRSSQV